MTCHTYIYDSKVNGLGGLPLGTNGKGMTLLSGGIDSPVATWMMAKRGMMIEAVHYHSYPYTSERAREKVIELAQIVSQYTGRFKMHVINLLPIQEEIVKNCPEEETTIHVRRFMMRIAEKLAKEAECQALITGEDLGQVASQTAEALVVTDSVVSMPVFRPLIGMDKIEIMEFQTLMSLAPKIPLTLMYLGVFNSLMVVRRQGVWSSMSSYPSSNCLFTVMVLRSSAISNSST